MRLKLAYLVVATLAQFLSMLTTQAGVVYDPGSDIPRARADEPFGLSSFLVTEGALSDKWQSAVAEINSDLVLLSDCRVRPDQCSSPAARFLNIVERAQPYDGLAKLAIINSGVNAVIKRDVAQQASALDAWPTALTTFNAGHGLCMNFAISKYTALSLAGWPASDMRLVIVWPERADQPHMVVAARHRGHWYILDNLRSALLIDGKASNYVPLFVFDDRGARQLGPAGSLARSLRDRANECSSGCEPVSLDAGTAR
jgi:predicted transglutaminase-like cysteine proteinase